MAIIKTLLLQAFTLLALLGAVLGTQAPQPTFKATQDNLDVTEVACDKAAKLICTKNTSPGTGWLALVKNRDTSTSLTWVDASGANPIETDYPAAQLDVTKYGNYTCAAAADGGGSADVGTISDLATVL